MHGLAVENQSSYVVWLVGPHDCVKSMVHMSVDSDFADFPVKPADDRVFIGTGKDLRSFHGYEHQPVKVLLCKPTPHPR